MSLIYVKITEKTGKFKKSKFRKTWVSNYGCLKMSNCLDQDLSIPPPRLNRVITRSDCLVSLSHLEVQKRGKNKTFPPNLAETRKPLVNHPLLLSVSSEKARSDVHDTPTTSFPGSLLFPNEVGYTNSTFPRFHLPRVQSEVKCKYFSGYKPLPYITSKGFFS